MGVKCLVDTYSHYTIIAQFCEVNTCLLRIAHVYLTLQDYCTLQDYYKLHIYLTVQTYFTHVYFTLQHYITHVYFTLHDYCILQVFTLHDKITLHYTYLIHITRLQCHKMVLPKCMHKVGMIFVIKLIFLLLSYIIWHAL